MTKVKLPRDVAEEMENYKGMSYSLATYFSYLFDHGRDSIKASIEFYYKNSDDVSATAELLARAWLDGYEIEEEQKYYVKVPIEWRNLNKSEWYFFKYPSSGIGQGNKDAEDEIEIADFQFTMDEIKEYKFQSFEREGVLLKNETIGDK